MLAECHYFGLQRFLSLLQQAQLLYFFPLDELLQILVKGLDVLGQRSELLLNLKKVSGGVLGCLLELLDHSRDPFFEGLDILPHGLCCVSDGDDPMLAVFVKVVDAACAERPSADGAIE